MDMEEKILQLDIDTILDKQFNIDFKGYSPEEVDRFLDLVVRDYDSYNQIISEFDDVIETKNSEIEALKNEVEELKIRLKQAEDASMMYSGNSGTNLTQIDILRRLARLEQEVFNRK